MKFIYYGLATVVFLFKATSPLAETHGQAVVKPDRAIVGDYGGWNVVFTVGDDGIQADGAIKIQFPNGWYSSPWPEGKLKNIQFDDPSGNHYAAVSSSGREAGLDLSIVREGVDGQHDRYGRSFVISLRDHPLLPGDTVTLTYRNTTAPTTSELQHVGVAVDAAGVGDFVPIESFPSLHLLPGKPVELRVLAESQAQVGKPARVTLVVLDSFFNATRQYRGTVHFESTDSTASLPLDYTFAPTDQGRKAFEVVFNSPGVYAVKVYEDSHLAPHGIRSNPVNVGKDFSPDNFYWGDLHSHSENSKDGMGLAKTAFRYAKEISSLDFYALTDHGAGDRQPDGKYWAGLTANEWEENKNLVTQYNKPGEFVTLLACEWSGGAPYGHHNVFYRNVDGLAFGEDQQRNVEEVWDLLQEGEAFTVPHHTGITWPGGGSPFTDWRLGRNDTFRTAIEIYSLWGSVEYFDNTMSYERYHLRNFTSHAGPNYARDGWAFGHYIGTVAGSDDHNAQPGRIHGGLTAVLASELSRNALFDAILRRHTYATTGERILLSFMINGHRMGDRLRLKPADSVQIEVKVVGTDRLEYVEVMKYDGRRWTVPSRHEPNGRRATISFLDHDVKSAIYYVRVKQWNSVHDREVRAWSSPIWVSREAAPWWDTGAQKR